MPLLDLFLHDQFVGSVEADPRDRTRVILKVDPQYSPSIALSESFAAIPGRRPPGDAVSNFLGGYVPEGHHREKMAAKRHIDPTDLMALLTQFGGSIAGAVTLRPPDESPAWRPDYEPLSEPALVAKLSQAITESDQGIPADSRSTLPGYQPKVLVASSDGQWVYPHGRAHSTHILKPQIPARPSRLVDEHYSHLLARRLGLADFASEIRTAGPLTYLAIERYDRTGHADDVLLHHQEDLAQAMGLDWRDTDVKFQEPDWPADPRRATVGRIAAVLGSIPGGGGLVESWIRHLTYHVAIGNNDSHAKNIALLRLPEGSRLAPVYDAVPNLFQEGLVSHDLALAVNGLFDHRRMSVENLLAEIASWRIVPEQRAATIMTRLLGQLAQALAEVAVPPGVSPGMIERLIWNTDQLLHGRAISEPKN